MTPTQFLFLLKNAFFRYYFHRLHGAKPSLMEILELIEIYTEQIKQKYENQEPAGKDF